MDQVKDKLKTLGEELEEVVGASTSVVVKLNITKSKADDRK